MTVFRDGYTTTLLTDGRVLVAGGCGAEDLDSNCLAVLASAELYNPTTDTWSATGSMAAARMFVSATRLLDGRVLVISNDDASAELYDPTTGTWSSTGSMSVSRANFTATLLLDGRVLVSGGCTNTCSVSMYL